MKPLLLTLLLGWLASAMLFAQAPQQFAFQGVARNGAGQPLSNQQVSLRISIHQGSTNGNTVYGETHAIQTANTGVFTVSVGGGSVYTGSFASINWGAGPYFLQVELDAAGGGNYAQVSTSQLLSVPYALAAKNLDGVNNPLEGDLLEYRNGTWSSKPMTKRYTTAGFGGPTNGGGAASPGTQLNFIGPVATVSIERDNPILSISTMKPLGSALAAGGTGLTLNLGYRKMGESVTEFNDAHRSPGLRVAGGNRIPFHLLGYYQTSFKAGETYEIGIIGFSTNATSWNDNGFGRGCVEVNY